MKNILAILALVVMSLSSTANAATRPYYQDIKLPTQKMIEKQEFTNLLAAASTRVLSAHAGNTANAAVSITSFAAQPDSPRNLTVTPAGVFAQIGTCTVTISGTDYLNNSISEDFSIAASGAAITGSKAFKTVTSVALPAACESSTYGAVWNVGIGEKIGLKRCMDNAGDIIFSLLDGAKEGTAPTMAANASVVSSNTADFNGTMDGTSDFVLYFMQNFRCVR
jgi:hypothetical protein